MSSKQKDSIDEQEVKGWMESWMVRWTVMESTTT